MIKILLLTITICLSSLAFGQVGHDWTEEEDFQWHIEGMTPTIEEFYENGGLKKRYTYQDESALVTVVDGQLHGIYKRWHSKDRIQLSFEYFYKKGNFHGTCRSWHRNGQLSTLTEYNDGNYHGDNIEWYENGNLKSKANYVNNERHGSRKECYENGQVRHFENYINGKKDGHFESYYQNGKPMSKRGYKNDLNHGEFEYFKENGNKYMMETYVNGELEGLYERYHDNGYLMKTGSYKQNQEDGLFKAYHNNGQLRYEKYYKQGKEIDQTYNEYDKDGNIKWVVEVSFGGVHSRSEPKSYEEKQNSTQTINEVDDVIYLNDFEVDEVAQFPDGKIMQNMFIANNTVYPDACVKMDAHGIVLISFIVEKNGSLTNIKVVRNNTKCDDLGKEAMRVVHKMPKWVPAVLDGKPVRTPRTVPFRFTLGY